MFFSCNLKLFLENINIQDECCSMINMETIEVMTASQYCHLSGLNWDFGDGGPVKTGGQGISYNIQLIYLLNIDVLLDQMKTGLTELDWQINQYWFQNAALICSDPWPHMTDISIYNVKLSANLKWVLYLQYLKQGHFKERGSVNKGKSCQIHIYFLSSFLYVDCIPKKCESK